MTDDYGNQTLSYFHWDDPSEAAGGNGVAGDGMIDQTVATRTWFDAEDRVTATARYTLDGAEYFSAAEELDGELPDWTTSTVYDGVGRVLSSTDRFGTTSYSLYDIRGNLLEVRTEGKDESGNEVWIVTRTAYDQNGRAIATTDPFVVENDHDPTHEAFSAEDDSYVTETTDFRLTHTVYDDLGRVKETWRLAGIEIGLEENTEGNVPIYNTSYTPPTGGNLDDAILARQETVYDDAGRVASAVTYDTTDATDPFGAVLHTVYFEYDALGRQTAVIQALDLDGDGLEVTFENGIPVSGEELIRTETAYDEAGRQKTATDAAGATTRFVYDGLGRCTGPPIFM